MVAAFVEAGDIGMAGKTEFFVFAKGAAMVRKMENVHFLQVKRSLAVSG